METESNREESFNLVKRCNKPGISNFYCIQLLSSSNPLFALLEAVDVYTQVKKEPGALANR